MKKKARSTDATTGSMAYRWVITLLLPFAMAVLACPAVAFSQMEKRESEEYLARQFAASSPVVGERAPELTLRTIDGRPVTIADYRGKNVVIIKAGYT